MSLDFTNNTNVDTKIKKIKSTATVKTQDISNVNKDGNLKEVPSLFEKLLNTTSAKTSKKIDTSDKSLKDTKNQTAKTTDISKKSMLPSSPKISLLDKMILDAKKTVETDVKKEPKEEVKSKIVEEKIDTKKIVTKEIKEESKVDTKVSKDIKQNQPTVIKEDIKDTKKDSSKVETNPKVITQAKDIKTTKQPLEGKEQKTENIKDVKDTKSILEVKSETKNESKEIKNTSDIKVSSDKKDTDNTPKVESKKVESKIIDTTEKVEKVGNIQSSVSKLEKIEVKTQDNIDSKIEVVKKTNIDTKVIINNDVKVKQQYKISEVLEPKIAIKEELKVTSSKVKETKSTDVKIVEKQISQAIEIDEVVPKKSMLFDAIIDNLPKEDIVTVSKKQTISDNKSNNKIEKKSKIIDTTKEPKTKDEMSASMFLSSQKKSSQIDQMQKIVDSKEVLEESKNIAGVEKSAKILELDASEIELEIEDKPKEIAKIVPTQKTQSISKGLHTTYNLVDKMVMINNNNNLSEQEKIIQLESLSTKDIATKDVVKKENIKEVIELNVSNSVAQVMHTKIIGARQQLGTFMSEVARNMYLNYKPPLTAFRMNLNPANLGSISIVMKSNKVEKSMNITMNMTNNNTLEAFSDNKTSLQSALQRTFTDSSTDISLDFGMQSDTSSQSFEQFKQEQQQNQADENDNLIVEQHESEEEVQTQDYM